MKNSRKKRAPHQRLQFSIIGLANAAVDIGSLNLLLFLFPTDDRSTLLLFNTVAYILAIINSYVWNSIFTFREAAKGSAKERIKFILQGLLSLGINNGVFLLFNGLLQFFGIPVWIRHNLAKGVAMFCSFAASYLMMKYLVFKGSARKNPEK
ncbi:GtrA family protein [Planococcus salinus]|uniref:GtrA family protein n=1 Tax=Planococcus salinus TaxID=1848460 RepID=A0A3M8PAW1_9BACL|nr:GtrA family protein [Planococcus salinus]RNF40837.1 GtrA family protein [Planococcus salinus]